MALTRRVTLKISRMCGPNTIKMNIIFFKNTLLAAWSTAFLLSSSLAEANEQPSIISQIQLIAESEGYEKALRQLDKELPKHQHLKSELLVLKAELRINNQQTQDAINIYIKLIRENPKNLSFFNNLAAIYASQGRLIEAERTILNGFKPHAEISTAYGNLLTIKGQQAAFALQLALDPEKPKNIITELKSLYMVNGMHVKAPKYSPSIVAESVPALEPDLPVITAIQQLSLFSNGPQAALDVVPLLKSPEIRAQEDRLMAFVNEWAAGWSSGNADRYLSFYSERFVPESKTNFTKWAEQRRQRITPDQGIQVQVMDVQAVSISPQQAELTFSQFYVSKTLRARSKKQLSLEQQNGQWLIVRERVVPR